MKTLRGKYTYGQLVRVSDFLTDGILGPYRYLETKKLYSRSPCEIDSGKC
jgi:hypothetical protein